MPGEICDCRRGCGALIGPPGRRGRGDGRRSWPKALAVGFALLLAWLPGPVPAAVDDAARELLRTRLEAQSTGQPLVAYGETVPVSEAVSAFYENRLYQPAWKDRRGQAEQLLRAIREASEEGLDPADYRPDRIAEALERVPSLRRRGELEPRRLVDFELLLTSSWLALASHSLHGKADPLTIDPQWEIVPRQADLVARLEEALDASRVYRSVRDLLPSDPGYVGLRKSLARYEGIRASGGWSMVPQGPTLRPGDEGDRVTALRRRLDASAWTDDLTTAGEPERFGLELEASVKAFQARHGLEADGLVGDATLDALNVPVADRIQQIEVNLERRRWMPNDLGERHILVNIAGFEMHVSADGERVIEQRVIVGRGYRQTPVFTGRMTYLVLNPSWEVPHSIASQDLLPKVQADRSYLDRMGFDLFRGWGANQQRIDPSQVDWQSLSPQRMPYRFRQRPGPLNALGQVKFMFPNKHAVYLHDTPERELFNRAERAFSSGCIRVEDPLELADYLISGSERWSPEALRRTLESRQETTVSLPQALPVHLQYLTAWTEDGVLQLRRDIYNRDSPVAAALTADRQDTSPSVEGAAE